MLVGLLLGDSDSGNSVTSRSTAAYIMTEVAVCRSTIR